MQKTSLIITLLIGLSFFSCNDQQEEQIIETEKEDTPVENTPEIMNSYTSLFEIPATDITRAIDFYERILDMEIEKIEMPEMGMSMGIFPYENQVVSGVIIQGEGSNPSPDGVTIYLNAGDDLQTTLDKVEPSGGEILLPKTPHADESGFFALFLDTEGNRLGLNSPN